MTNFVTNRTDLATFRVIVSTAGTAVNFDALPVPDNFMLIIKALEANTNNILVGNSSDTVGTIGFELAKGQSIGYRITNANLIWIDSVVSGEGVSCSVEQHYWEKIMTILAVDELAKMRRRMAVGQHPDWDKSIINAALQAIEDWYQTNKVQGSTDIDTATSPFTFTNAQKKKLFGYWMEHKFKMEVS